MNIVLLSNRSLLPDRLRMVLLLFFLALLGSHFLDYHLYIFIIASLFLIDWKHINTKNMLPVALFLLSMYGTWVFLDPRLLHPSALSLDVFSRGLMIMMMYLLGLSVKIPKKDHKFISDKVLFYTLFIFVISYTFFVFWSYVTIPQDTPLTGLGMFVCFPNPYQQAQVNGGRLISTVLTYYLTLMGFLFPFLIVYFNRLRKQGFSLIELLLLAALSLFVLYISAVMGRRTVYVLLGAVAVFLFLTKLIDYRPSVKRVKQLLVVLFTVGVTGYGYHHFTCKPSQNTQIDRVVVLSDMVIPIMKSDPTLMERLHLQQYPIVNKLMHRGLKDQRFFWWSKVWKVILDHPYGGGHDVLIAPHIYLAHNTWLDVGKAFGVPTFFFFLLLTFVHLYYLIRILFSRVVDILLKSQMMILVIGFFGIMMIEPVFNSDKTFFAYIFFYFGIVANLYSNIKKGVSQETSL